MDCAIYLRKSRADLEAEMRGEGETLSKHKGTLLSLAREQGLNIIAIREEIASGDSIADRPQMMKLLEEVEDGRYDAVLVMDIDRLSRGNMRDQGIILDAFRRSGTKIITPRKTYDLRNELDEEWTEFEAFLARREYKMISRRLIRGRNKSVESGKWIFNLVPYGYQVVYHGKERHIEPHPEEAPVVQMIFKWYTEERIGTSKIAWKLNEMGIKPPRSDKWKHETVSGIIRNPVYIGLIQWKKRKPERGKDGKKISKCRPPDEWEVVKGKHQPIISESTFNKAQELRKQRLITPHFKKGAFRNPFAGIAVCGECGRTLTYQRVRETELLRCKTEGCTTCGISLKKFETYVLDELEKWLENYTLQWNPKARPDKMMVDYEQVIRSLENQLQEEKKTKERLYDLLERGIYDEETFLNRSSILASRIAEIEEKLRRITEEWEVARQQVQKQTEFVPNVKRLLGMYWKTEDPKQRNVLLKSVLHRVVYRRPSLSVGFTADIYPKLPYQPPLSQSVET